MSEDPIGAVWERYKHLDALLLDLRWLVPDSEGGQLRVILHDLWAAVRDAATRKE